MQLRLLSLPFFQTVLEAIRVQGAHLRTNEAEKRYKVYVEVELHVDRMGKMVPTRLQWEDGRWFEIDRVIDIRPGPALKAGGQGDRYTVRIGNQQRVLFFEHTTHPEGPIPGRWFVERL